MTSADYTLQAIKGIKKDFDNAAKFSIEKYADNRIFSLYQTDEVFEIYTSTEGLSGTKKLGELETPPTNKLEEGYSVTIEEERYGNAVVIPEKVYRRDGKDSSTKVQNYLAKQAAQLLQDVRHKFLSTAFTPLNEGHDSSSDYLAPDGVEFFGAHTWQSGATFDNSATEAMDAGAIDTMTAFGGAFTDAEGKPMPIDYDTIIVKKGSAAAREARKLFAYDIHPTTVGDINIYQGEFAIVETPYITNALYWYAVDSKLDNPFKVGVGEYPTMRDPQTLENEAIRSNCTGFWKIGIVNMPYAWYSSVGSS